MDADPTVIRSERNPSHALVLNGVDVTEEDIKAVFKWLDAWEIAAPFRDYAHLACDEGTVEERQFTAELIGDLRQPLYDSRAIWMREDSVRAKQFVKRLGTERKKCTCAEGPCDLAFLRALWKVKPLILALPRGFIQPEKGPVPASSRLKE